MVASCLEALKTGRVFITSKVKMKLFKYSLKNTIYKAYEASFPWNRLSGKQAKDTKYITISLKVSTPPPALYRNFLKSCSHINKEAHRKYRKIFTTCLRLRKTIENYYQELIDMGHRMTQ